MYGAIFHYKQWPVESIFVGFPVWVAVMNGSSALGPKSPWPSPVMLSTAGQHLNAALSTVRGIEE